MKDTIENLLTGVGERDRKALARTISLVENEVDGYANILLGLKPDNSIPVIGITGPPGSGKSTLVNGLLKNLTEQNKQIGVIAIDPTSPFNLGSLLGDRIRMRDHFNNPHVFIRSLATRGSLGGLSAKTIEIVDIMRSACFDFIFVETVGVGQTEIEIIGVADTTILVLVPESGDEIQIIKSGIMEIADIFVVNKSDREGAAAFAKNLHYLLKEKLYGKWKPPVIQAVATRNEGIEQIIENIELHARAIESVHEKKMYLITEKAYKLIQDYKMRDVNKTELQQLLLGASQKRNFNLYAFVKDYLA